jgi:hypothetical protein
MVSADLRPLQLRFSIGGRLLVSRTHRLYCETRIARWIAETHTLAQINQSNQTGCVLA